VTLTAVEQASRLKSQWLQWSEAHGDKHPSTLEAVDAWNAEFSAEKRRFVCNEYQVWAARGVQVVFSQRDLPYFDQWLIDYAESVLQLQARQMTDYAFPSLRIEPLIRAVRDSLTAIVLHWKSEARRVCAMRESEAEEHKRALQAETAKAVRSTHGGKAEPPSFRNRAAWFERELNQRKWTTRELQSKGGPDARTARRILDGHPVSDAVLQKLAQTLSLRGTVERSDIPKD